MDTRNELKDSSSPARKGPLAVSVTALVVLLGAGTLFVLQSCSATPPADPQAGPGAKPTTSPTTPATTPPQPTGQPISPPVT